MNRPAGGARRRAWRRPAQVALALVVALVGTGLREATQPSPGWADAAPPLTLTPVADATVASGRPTTNLGQAMTLEADEKPRHESFLR